MRCYLCNKPMQNARQHLEMVHQVKAILFMVKVRILDFRESFQIFFSRAVSCNVAIGIF